MKRLVVFLVCLAPVVFLGCSQVNDLICLSADNMVTTFYDGSTPIGMMAMRESEPFGVGQTQGNEWKCEEVCEWSPEVWEAICLRMHIDPKVCLRHMATGAVWCPLESDSWGRFRHGNPLCD